MAFSLRIKCMISHLLIFFHTLARFAVPTESHLTGTKIRSFIVLTVRIEVTWGRNSTALVNIYKKYRKPFFKLNVYY